MRLDLAKIDGPHGQVLRIRIRIERRGRTIEPAGEERLGDRVVFEDRELGADFSAHGRDGPAVRHLQRHQAGAAEFDVAVAVRAVAASDLEEHVLAGRPRGELSGEFVAHRRRNGIPDHALGDGLQRVGQARAAPRAVHGAGSAGVRVRADQQLARPGQSRFRRDHVRDAVAPHVEHPPDAKLGGKAASFHHGGCIADRVGGHRMVEDDCHALRIEHCLRLVPAALQRHRHVQVDHHVRPTHDHFAGPHLVTTGGPGENFLNDGRSHGVQAQSMMMLALLTTLAQPASSVRIWLANCSGVLPTGSRPIPV